jgi:hypothetical protein
MRRQPEREQLNRLTVKTLDQVFVMRAKEGLGYSQFEAQALTNLVKEVYFPWLSQPPTRLPTSSLYNVSHVAVAVKRRADHGRPS